MSEKCRLCLKIIPIESAIVLYHILNATTEPVDMVKLIERYLQIKVEQDDIVSTMICQDCNDHLEEFHKFSNDVAAKQLTLQTTFLQANFKKESCFDEEQIEKQHSNREVMNDEEKVSTDEQPMFEYPIDTFKLELNSEDDDDELCAQDMLKTDLNEEADEYKPPEDIHSSEDDMPLINLKSRKKKTSKISATTSRKSRSQSKAKQQHKEPKQKKQTKQKKISGKQLIATSMDLKCDICETQVNTWKELRQHFLLAHTRTPYVKCCGNLYEKQRPLVDHLQWHKNPDAFKCQLCDENLANSRDLTTHISSVHPDNVDLLQHYECEHCFKEFRSFTIYKNHLRSHDKEKDVECHICNKRYASKYQLCRHIDSFHKGVYFHICDVCGKKFKCKDSFKKHYQGHQGFVDQAVQCSICKTWLKNENSLRLHRFVHEEHINECETCGKVFKTRHNLRRHVAYWHDLDRNLQCTMCDKVFRQKRNLDEHMATHTGIQLYACPHCGKESRSRSNMYVHVKRMHPNEWWKSKMERLNLDPNTENPELQKHQQMSQDVLNMYTHFLSK